MHLILLFALAKPVEPLKPWTHDMCHVRQKYATAEYIAYCRAESADQHPSCPANDSKGRANQARKQDAAKQSDGKEPVFEYYDCSWHPNK